MILKLFFIYLVVLATLWLKSPVKGATINICLLHLWSCVGEAAFNQIYLWTVRLSCFLMKDNDIINQRPIIVIHPLLFVRWDVRKSTHCSWGQRSQQFSVIKVCANGSDVIPMVILANWEKSKPSVGRRLLGWVLKVPDLRWRVSELMVAPV